MREPVLGADQRRPDRLRGGVVLVDDRSPPVDHLLLDLHRARRGGVHHPLQAGHVIRITHGFRQFQHPDEHGRHELSVRDPVALDGIQRTLGVELLHDHRGDATGLHGHRPHRRRGVVERRRAQIDRIRVHPEADQGRHHARRLGRRDVRQFAFDSLGPAGGARRVLQQVAFDLVGDRRIRLIRNTFRVALPARQVACRNRTSDQQQRRQTVRQMLGQARAGLAQRRRPDDRLGAAVVDDVGRLGRGQVGVDRHVVQAAAPGRPHDRVDVLVVLHQDRDAVALAQTGLPELVRQPVGPGFQLVEGDHRAGRVKDDSGLVGAQYAGESACADCTVAKLDGCQGPEDRSSSRRQPCGMPQTIWHAAGRAQRSTADEQVSAPEQPRRGQSCPRSDGLIGAPTCATGIDAELRTFWLLYSPIGVGCNVTCRLRRRPSAVFDRLRTVARIE